MKKLLSCVLMLGMLLSVLTAFPCASAGDVGSTDGDYLTFDLSCSIGTDGILTVLVETVCVYGETACTDIPYDCVSALLVYDPAVLTLSNPILGEGELDCIAKSPDATWENASIVTAEGILLRSCTTEGGAHISNETPLVFVLRFEVAPDATATAIEIPDASVEVIDYDFNYRDGKGAALQITLARTLYGDANGDGNVNGADAVRLLGYLANYDHANGSSTVEIAAGADCNGDGSIDGKDPIRLLRYLASYDPETDSSDVVLGK